jgi:phosphoglycerate dehydrogenase-like enzyme
MRLVVAVHDPPVWTIPPAEVARIAAALPDVEVIDARDPASRLEHFPAADVLLATRLTAEEAARAARARWIHTTAVGVGGVLQPAVLERPIVVTNTRGTHGEAIAEHAIALALALRRRLHVALARQAERRWAQEEISRSRVPALSASQLLVLGLGGIGSRVAALGAGLGMRVEGIRRRLDLPAPPGVARVRPLSDLHDALAAADVVVLALPGTGETRALLGAHELGAMRRGAVLVNVARGRLVDDGALIDALRSGRLGGAGMDAFEREPLPPDHPFWTLPNVIITPHTAAFAGDYWRPAVDLFLENFARFRRGDPLLNVVDKAHGY